MGVSRSQIFLALLKKSAPQKRRFCAPSYQVSLEGSRAGHGISAIGNSAARVLGPLPRRRARTPVEVVSMDKPVESLSLRVLLLQMLAHTLIFLGQNVGNVVERVLLAPDTAACAALGLSGATFCLFSAFATNVVNVCQVVTARPAT